ncbi:hypothetical protein NDU88_001391 [Pleurodeles waltl]|uniref:Uncharacterized protein n=1 Tax=Pleurodeles waltl TaxID=8319 RepID=A0AAV7VA94_PLEWA|nr:hypothetical protein NDU88_001391 [Pleurodeles waltl]
MAPQPAPPLLPSRQATGEPPQPPQSPPRWGGLVSAVRASRQPPAANPQRGPGPNPVRVQSLTGGPRTDKTTEAPPPASATPHLPSTGPQGEPLPAQQQLRARPAAPSVPLRLRPSQTPAGPQHSTGSPGSEPVNSRTGGDPVRSQMPPVGGSAYSTPESGEIENLSPKSGRASHCDGHLAGRLAPPPR